MVDKDAHYLMNKGGVFYFTRHVPNDLQCHYARPRIVICLKTRSPPLQVLSFRVQSNQKTLKSWDFPKHLEYILQEG